jgi:hypothetical protein|tara:strand:- start:43 stop:462 length:420 start_codon:yes stop_codon:yes gene_type:complete
MALPASGPISGSQIATELGITGVAASNLSLGGMIDSSSLSNTNPDEYSEFYGYSNVTLTSFTGSASQGGSKFICNQSLNTSYWHNGSSAYPTVGTTIYTNSGGTATIGGGSAGYVKLNSLQYAQFNSSGVVTNLNPCFL